MDSNIEFYLQQLNSPGTPDIRNLIMYSKDLRSSQMSVKPLTISGMNKLCLCCLFRHNCMYRGAMYSIPMELVIPQQFARDVPMLFIRPDRGSKIVPIDKVVDISGYITFEMVKNLCYRMPMDHLLNYLDIQFGNAFPICADTKAKFVDDCLALMKTEFIDLYNKYKHNYEELNSKIEDIRSTENIIQAEIPKVQASVKDLEKRHANLAAFKNELTTLQERLQTRPSLEEEYIHAFHFKNSSQRLFLELEACELSHKELNDYLVATLSKTNMDEVIDLIRENGKQLFEARYLKQVVKARMESSLTN